MSILVFSKDPGGTNNILPVVRELRLRGHQVDYFLPKGSKGADQVQKSGEKHHLVSSAEDVLVSSRNPTLFVTSTCSKGFIGRDLIPVFRKRGVPSVAIQDNWGGQLKTDFFNEEYRADFICVGDAFGKQIVEGMWEGYPRDHIMVTGFPDYDSFAFFDVAKAKRKVSDRFSLDNRPVVLVAGQFHCGDTLGEVVRALNDLSEDTVVFARKHPRMDADAPEEGAMWDKAVASLVVGTMIADSSHCTTTELVAASTVIVAPFAATLTKDAVLLRKQNIAMLYGGGMDGFRRIYDAKIVPDLATVVTGCTAKASSYDHLKNLLWKALHKDLGLKTHQEATYRADGNNSSRVVDFLESF